MPEAPQVRIIANKLQPFVKQKIVKATTLEKDFDVARLEGETIQEILVFGKQILIRFTKFTVRYHLLMFGVVRINDSNPNGKLRLGLKFKDSEFNFYAGDIYYIDEPLNQVFDWSTDTMSDKWDAKKALNKLKNHEEELISDVLIDQNIFNGLGNKGVNEVLYRTKVHPASTVGALSAAKKKDIIKEAVDFSFDYFDWEQKGVAKENFSVYLKKTCPVHGTVLKHEQIGTNGRKCHYCDECQKLYVK
jgi:endonuclease-8